MRTDSRGLGLEIRDRPYPSRKGHIWQTFRPTATDQRLIECIPQCARLPSLAIVSS